MRIDIAGLNIQYRNSLDLNERVKKHLVTTHARRLKLDQDREQMLKREKTLERFLGQDRPAAHSDIKGGAHE